MKKVWNETTAVNYLDRLASVKMGVKSVFAQGGLNGLTACSAADYLKNYCGYSLFI